MVVKSYGEAEQLPGSDQEEVAQTPGSDGECVGDVEEESGKVVVQSNKAGLKLRYSFILAFAAGWWI